jgi:hypothetical protein
LRGAAASGALVLALLGAPGCGTEGRESAARHAAERFYAAFEAEDGDGACTQLTEEAQSALERNEQRPCEEAVLDLELSPARPSSVQVAVTSAIVDTEEGDTAFLDQTSSGWKLSAVGCEEVVGQPYECELEA